MTNLKQLSFGTEGVCNAIVVEIWSTRNILGIFPCVSFLSRKNWNSSLLWMLTSEKSLFVKKKYFRQTLMDQKIVVLLT